MLDTLMRDVHVYTQCSTRIIKKTFKKMKEYVGIYMYIKTERTRLGCCLALAKN